MKECNYRRVVGDTVVHGDATWESGALFDLALVVDTGSGFFHQLSQHEQNKPQVTEKVP